MANVVRYLESWDHGVSPVATGGGLAFGLSGTPTVGSGFARTPGFGLQCNLTAGTDESVDLPNLTGGQAVAAISCWVNVQSFQAGQHGDVLALIGTGVRYGMIGINSSGQWQFQWDNATGVTAGPAVVTSKWTLLELLIDFHANPWTARWRIDGVDQTVPATFALAATTLLRCSVGYFSAATKTGEVWFDDLIIIDGTDQTMWPIGSYDIRAVTADQAVAAAHQGTLTGWFYSDNNFTGTTGITTSTETASRSRVDDLGGTDGVENTSASAAGNLRYPVADPPALGTPRAVALITASKMSATGTANATFRTLVSASTTNHFTGTPGTTAPWTTPMVGTTLGYIYTCMNLKPGATAWTYSDAQGINFEFASTDGSPNPQLMGFVYQVAFPQSIYSKSGYGKENG